MCVCPGVGEGSGLPLCSYASYSRHQLTPPPTHSQSVCRAPPAAQPPAELCSNAAALTSTLCGLTLPGALSSTPNGTALCAPLRAPFEPGSAVSLLPRALCPVDAPGAGECALGLTERLLVILRIQRQEGYRLPHLRTMEPPPSCQRRQRCTSRCARGRTTSRPCCAPAVCS